MSDEMVPIHRTGDVFVAGGIPKGTYNPRTERKIETTIYQYLAETGKALTISGASKSGKTSLVERVLPDDVAIWLQGQDIQNLSDFWHQLGMHLDVGQSATKSQGSDTGVATRFDVSAGVPKVAGGGWSRTDDERSNRSTSVTSDINIADAVRVALAASRQPIVIDDFHFIPDDVKQSISRAIKTIVRNSSLILIAVPSEAFELVRTEPEMSGRVWSLPIPAWSPAELDTIGTKGFELLQLVDDGNSVARELASVSYGSPFIMQQLCHDIVRWEMAIEETARNRPAVVLPHDVDRFLSSSADRAAPPLFPKLLAGAATKGNPRQIMSLRRGGTRTDIYGAVLTAIKNLVPRTVLPERDVVAEVQRISTTTVNSGRVNNALRQLHNIAEKSRGTSDPVLRLRDETLYIEDSMLAFYLAHGSWTAEK